MDEIGAIFPGAGGQAVEIAAEFFRHGGKMGGFCPRRLLDRISSSAVTAWIPESRLRFSLRLANIGAVTEVAAGFPRPFGRAPEGVHNPARNPGRHSASKRTSPPGAMIRQGLFTQRVEPPGERVRLDLGIPFGRVIFREPAAETGQLVGSKRLAK